MNCNFCDCRLNYLQLRQVFDDSGEDLYEIECFNPSCRKLNYLSRKGYFTLKKEIGLITRKMSKLNNKLPEEQKILMISMERSGSSWVAAHISIEYMKVFGSLPLWNHECDRRYAVFKRIKTPEGIFKVETPEGWTSVYDIDPKDALEKDFDKIILLEKPLEALKEDICKYNHPEKWELEIKTKDDPTLLEDPKVYADIDFLVRLRKAVEREWNRMFGQDIDDPRVYRIKLDDLNNFTEWEWMKFCDWFGFPERLQCHPFAVNRNWQVYSDVLPTGYPLCSRLRQLQEIHPNVLAQELLREELFFTDMKKTGKLTDATDYPFVHKFNPYIRLPVQVESIPVETRSFRITHDGEIKDVLKEGRVD